MIDLYENKIIYSPIICLSRIEKNENWKEDIKKE